ncbi:MAG: ATP-binding protein [Thermoplasmata archaeon]|nr:MAG: ATP-binding protein [Deltaproteobacteria bacterium]RLF60689.1 MAG: ATP-binding protein [Thermoplasmata archaeon]
MNRETIKYVLTDFHSRPLPKVFDRDLKLPLDLNKVISLVGIRRSGKTSLLYSTMQRLIEEGVNKKDILYLNFEDDRLFPIKLSEMDLVLRAYHELYPEKLGKTKYMFLDEIQQVDGWEKYVRRIYDTEDIRIYVTGSSSKVVSSGISTSLRGRTISFEVFPLSFKEFLCFKGIEIKQYSTSQEARIINALNEYLLWGGFPEVAKTDDSYLRVKILHEYADLILYKDLIEQYGIKNQYLLKYLLKHFMVNPATLFSLNKLYNDLRSQGVSASKNSLYEYVEYLRRAYILFKTVKYSRSFRAQMQNPSKNYIVDTGLIRVYQADPSRDIGRKLENAVYMHLRASENVGEIFYHKNRFEIDFVYQKGKDFNLLNVSYNLDTKDTAKREVNGLLKGKKCFPHARTALLLNDWQPEFIPEDVKIIPAWQFLAKM